MNRLPENRREAVFRLFSARQGHRAESFVRNYCSTQRPAGDSQNEHVTIFFSLFSYGTLALTRRRFGIRGRPGRQKGRS